MIPPSSLIMTISGRWIDPLRLHPSEVQIEDIAHALSNICRFTGHVTKFYSVAEHCLRVARMVPPHMEMIALLHDASEAYVADVSRPLKRQPEFEAYRRLEERVMWAIGKKFGFEWPEPDKVKWADREACRQEGSALVPGWTLKPQMPYFDPVVGLTPVRAKKLFLQKFDQIWRESQ